MWIIRIKVKHDCIIGNRCEKFKVTTTGTAFNVFRENGITYAPQMQVIHGNENQTKDFIRDLKKDKRVKHLETEGNIIFLVEIRKDKIPSTFYNPKLIYVKPVFVDEKGYEYWEVASWQRKVLTDFIEHIEKDIGKVEILKLEQTKLTNVYFSRLMPKLTEHQKQAVELAFKYGFYEWPKKTDLGKLAKVMRISIPTFREHLKRAEEKLMPDLMKLIE